MITYIILMIILMITIIMLIPFVLIFILSSGDSLKILSRSHQCSEGLVQQDVIAVVIIANGQKLVWSASITSKLMQAL